MAAIRVTEEVLMFILKWILVRYIATEVCDSSTQEIEVSGLLPSLRSAWSAQ